MSETPPGDSRTSRGTRVLRWLLRAVLVVCFVLATWGSVRSTSVLISSPLWRAIFLAIGFVFLGLDRLFPQAELPTLRAPFERKADDDSLTRLDLRR
jgi:hypothetical protein